MAKRVSDPKPYRLLYADVYGQLPSIDLLVIAHNKAEAESKGYEQIQEMALNDLKLITEGAVSLSKDVLMLSRRYFNTLVNGCWTLVECEVQVSVSKHASKRSEADVHAAADKRRTADGKKRRWSKAKKRAMHGNTPELSIVAA